MSKVWKWEKNFFGEWELRQRNDSDGAAILYLVVIIFIALVVISLTFLLSPLIIALLGFGMVDSKRYYAGIGSAIALLYLLYDIKKKWVTAYLIYGYTDSNGKFNSGFLGDEFVKYLYCAWAVGGGLALFFIIKSVFLNKK